jgi:hypothetical protein
LAIPPGAAVFLPKGSLSPFRSDEELAGCRFIPITSSQQSLQVSFSHGELEVTNKATISAELQEILIVSGHLPDKRTR